MDPIALIVVFVLSAIIAGLGLLNAGADPAPADDGHGHGDDHGHGADGGGGHDDHETHGGHGH